MTVFMWLVSVSRADPIAEAAQSFQVPTYSSKQLALVGEDLLSMVGTQEGLETFEGQLSLVYNLSEQTPQRTRSVGNALTLYYSNEGNYALSAAAEESFAITNFRYFDDPTGLYQSSRGAFGIGRAAEFPLVSDAVGGVGVGYGRILDVRTLVQAQEMFNILEREASAEDLQRVAELIGRRNEYFQNYQYDADIHFYEDIAEALGGTTTSETYQIQQVLDSPLYNIGSRYVGWQAGADLDIAVGDLAGSEDPEEQDGVTARIGFGGAKAFTVGDSSILIPLSVSCLIVDNAVQNLTDPLPGALCFDPGLSITLDLSSALSIDHSSSWNSSFSAGTSQTYNIFPNTSVQALKLFAGVQSNAALGSKLVWNNGFQIESAMVADEENTLDWELKSTLTYYIF